MAYYFLKLLPPRSTFVQDMSAEEAAIMGAHAAYWQKLIEEGTHVLALGVVLDPAGAFGMGVVEVKGEDRLRELLEKDPVARANFGARFEFYPMPRGVMHSS